MSAATPPRWPESSWPESNWPLPLALYALAGRMVSPALRLYLQRRVTRGKENPARLGERWGRATLPRPAGRLVWLHAASVGEMLSVLPLIERLQGHIIDGQPLTVLLTTGTLTSAELAAQRLPEGAIHQFVPLDVPQAAKRFFEHWQPDIALFVESEFWPNLMREAYRRKVPLGLINGRMSERSFARWRKHPALAQALLASLSFCLAQSEGDAQRLGALGAPARFGGNLKYDGKALPLDLEQHAALTRAIGPRPVLLAASTHPGEEMLVLEASAALRNQEPELLTIIVPRHPERGAEIAALAASGGMRPLVRSLGEVPDDLTTLYLADTLGELGLFYALATASFIGGSLVSVGGHNPIEPARLGTPILTGPHVTNFADIYAEFIARGAAVMVEDADALARQAARLMRDAAARDVLAQQACRVAEANTGAIEAALTTVIGHLKGAA
jgi:3-deoxy-D-manno-octulosonic-acid transferase